MKRIAFFIAVFLLSLAPACRAANWYIAQTAAGAGTGADCADALAITYFNTSSNWAVTTTSGKISAGDTVHFCGTITTTPTVQASGAASNPITLLFESGAMISEPHCDNSVGCLNTGNMNYLVINGGTNGIVQATATGSGLAYTTKGIGVYVGDSTNVEIKNLTIQNIYVHSSQLDTADQDPPEGCVFVGDNGATNISIHDSTCHDSKWGFCFTMESSGSGIQIYNNNIYNVDHGVTLGEYGASYIIANLSVHNNHIHDFCNWDTGTADSYHHDGVHVYAGAGGHINNGLIYDNIFDGCRTNALNMTADIYVENADAVSPCNNWSVFNNVSLPSTGTSGGANFGTISVGNNTGVQVYNNTLIGNCQATTSCYGLLVAQGNTTLKNNIIEGFNSAVDFYNGPAPNTVWDYNLYANNANAGTQYPPYAQYTTVAAWITYLQSLNASNEVHAVTATDALLSSTGQPTSTSPAIKVGANLTSLGITQLDQDRAGSYRPASGAWDIGAYMYGTGNPPPSGGSGGYSINGYGVNGYTIQ